jgi:GTP cyclohydrolase IA
MELGDKDPLSDRIWNGFEYVKHEPQAPRPSAPVHGPKALHIESLLKLIEPGNEVRLREGLQDTPNRVAKAFTHWFGGYTADIKEILATQFQDGGEGYDEMVIVKDIPFYSKCEHHMADIFGTVTIAYIPNGKVVGLSKLSRCVDAYARRLQVQERLTKQIADALVDHLQPLGVGVLIKARHMCMESRGICQQGHHTITSALRGVLKSEAAARAEFMALA